MTTMSFNDCVSTLLLCYKYYDPVGFEPMSFIAISARTAFYNLARILISAIFALIKL